MLYAIFIYSYIYISVLYIFSCKTNTFESDELSHFLMNALSFYSGPGEWSFYCSFSVVVKRNACLSCICSEACRLSLLFLLQDKYHDQKNMYFEKEKQLLKVLNFNLILHGFPHETFQKWCHRKRLTVFGEELEIQPSGITLGCFNTVLSLCSPV